MSHAGTRVAVPFGYEIDRCERYNLFREFIDVYKAQSGCVDCGYSAHPAALEFDHRDPCQKVGKIASMFAHTDANPHRFTQATANAGWHTVRVPESRASYYPKFSAACPSEPLKL